MAPDFGDRPIVLPSASKIVPRTRCLSTKLTEAEYAACVEHARSRRQTLSAWTRDALITAATQRPIEQVLLAEVLALRTIVINLQISVVTRGAPTPDHMQALIDRADQDKLQRAIQRLEATRHP